MGFVVLSSLASSTALADDKAACVDAYGKSQKLRGENQLVSAREQLRVCARSTCPKFITKDCTTWLVDVESRLPSIVPFAKDASGAEISKATVTMDGTVIAQDLDGHAIEVDGGHHTFTFTFADGRKVDREFVVAEGQKAQRVEVTMPAPEPAAAPRDTATPVQVWGTPAAASEGSSWSGRKTLALAVAGVGVAGLAVGTIFGLNAASSYSSQQNDCHSSAPGDCVNRAQAVTDHDNAASASTISTIGFIAGGALVAAGAVLFFTAPKQGEEARSTPSAGLEVIPGAAPGSAGMWVRGRF